MKIQVILAPFQTRGRKEVGIIPLTWTLHPDCSCPNNVCKEMISSNKIIIIKKNFIRTDDYNDDNNDTEKKVM